MRTRYKSNTVVFLLIYLSISCQFIFAGKIQYDSPKIILSHVQFNIGVDSLSTLSKPIHLYIDNELIDTKNPSKHQIVFKDIVLDKIGTKSFKIKQANETLLSFTKTVIPGWISILPPLIAITLAFILRTVVPALFVAIWFGAWATNGLSLGGLFTGLLESFHVYILNTFIDRDHAAITLFTLMLGGMVGIVYRNGGMHGIIYHLIKRANTPKKGQIAVWLFGLVIFFDDYSNTLIVGNTSRMLCDKLRISRQKLAYLVDSTSAPVSTIAVITTWIGFQVGIIADSIKELPGLNESAYLLFLHSIPYSFYPFLAIFLVGLVVTTGRDIGPMVDVELNARKGQENIKLEQDQERSSTSEDLQVKMDIPYRAINAVLPISILVISMVAFIFATGEGNTIKDILGSADTFAALMHSTLLSTIMATGLSVGQRILSINEVFEAWYNGLKFMVMGMLVLIMAWALADISAVLQTADYIVAALGDAIPMNILPAVVFLIAAITAFGSGSSWGVMAILMPLVIPLCWAIMENNGGANPENYHILYSTIACVLTGAVWADHCSPISDTTILTSMASGCELMDHVYTQLPYAAAAGVTALLCGTIPAAFGLPWWLLFGISAAVLVLFIYKYGVSIDQEK